MPLLGTLGSSSARNFGFALGLNLPPAGQAAFTTPGVFAWTVPDGVTSVSVVAVGGGGAGLDNWANPAGSGGGLGWKNNITVTPGATYQVVVGAGGNSDGDPRGGNSYFINPSIVAGYGGGNPGYGLTGGPNANNNGGGFVGDGGGAGGSASNWTGGGGAGGYTGRGGDGNIYEPSRNGTGGGNGGGNYSSTYGTGAGGGVGILGLGATGIYFNVSGYSGYTTSTSSGGGGQGGSGGTDGFYGQNPWTGVGQSSNNIQGGDFGGGGGGPGTSWPAASGNGGRGAVRIIWSGKDGSGVLVTRAFPSTNTGNY